MNELALVCCSRVMFRSNLWRMSGEELKAKNIDILAINYAGLYCIAHCIPMTIWGTGDQPIWSDTIHLIKQYSPGIVVKRFPVGNRDKGRNSGARAIKWVQAETEYKTIHMIGFSFWDTHFGFGQDDGRFRADPHFDPNQRKFAGLLELLVEFNTTGKVFRTIDTPVLECFEPSPVFITEDENVISIDLSCMRGKPGWERYVGIPDNLNVIN